MKKSQKLTILDIATWAGFMIFAVSGTIVAISLPEISATFSTNLTEGGGMETMRTMLVLIVLLLAGILAQRWGKKRFLTLGQYLMATGFLLASFAPSYPTLILALMLMGIGGGFSEALMNPLIADIHKKEAGRYLNISHAFYPLGIMSSALIFGELLTQGYSWRLLFQISAAATLLLAITFTLVRFPPAVKDDSSYPKLFGSILSLPGFWLFGLVIILAGAIEAALTFWGRTYVGAYLSDIPRSGAIAIVFFAAAMAFGRFLTGYLANKTSLNNIMVGSAILGLVISIFIPMATNLTWFYALFALAGLAIACYWPTILAEADDFLNVNTTILFVLLSAVGMVGFGLTPWIMGIIGDNVGLRAGFAIIPLLYIGLIALLIIERKKSQRVIPNQPAFENEPIAAAEPLNLPS